MDFIMKIYSSVMKKPMTILMAADQIVFRINVNIKKKKVIISRDSMPRMDYMGSKRIRSIVRIYRIRKDIWVKEWVTFKMPSKPTDFNILFFVFYSYWLI